MTYNVKIEVFEGPFDLLFHLIEKNQIDIYDIPMVEITEQYISYIQKLEELNLDITSEFLVMAATLIEIKSRMLLPIQVMEDKQIELEDLDPRGDLVRKLIEYKKYKIAVEELKSKEERYQKIYFKPREEFIFNEDEQTNINMDYVDIKDLVNAIDKLIKRQESIFSKKAFRIMPRDTITIKDQIEKILKLLNKNNKIQFSNIFSKTSTKVEIITTFLALLELIRLKKVTASQSIAYTDIIIELKPEEVEDAS